MIVVGSVWDYLPALYNITSVYCTPSVMEGFGMSVQEAAATQKAVIASDLVPFVCEYILGDKPQKVSVSGEGETKDILQGEGGFVVPADFVPGFAQAMTSLLQDDALRNNMGKRALDITIPYFTWENRAKDLMNDLGVSA